MSISILGFYKVALYHNISSSYNILLNKVCTILLHQQAMIWVGCFHFLKLLWTMLLWASCMLQVSCFAFKWMNATLKRHFHTWIHAFQRAGLNHLGNTEFLLKVLCPVQWCLPLHGHLFISLIWSHILQITFSLSLCHAVHTKKAGFPSGSQYSITYNNCPTLQTKEKAPVLQLAKQWKSSTVRLFPSIKTCWSCSRSYAILFLHGFPVDAYYS